MCHLGTNAVQTINRGIADVSRLAKSTNPNATPAPKVTDMVSVHDLKAQSHHELYIYRLDYRPRSAKSVGNVVAFSKPRFAACWTEKLKLGTPAHYRDEKKHKPGIGDNRDGTLTKDGTAWARTISPSVTVTSAEMTFASRGEPWVYCAAHYRTNAELRWLKKHFADEYGYRAATRITDPDTFAIWLGIQFAMALDKTTDVKLDVWDELGYARSTVTTDLQEGPQSIDTFVRVYHGPVHYTDRSGQIERGMVRSECWPEGVVHEEDSAHDAKRIPVRRHHAWQPRETGTLHRRVARDEGAHSGGVTREPYTESSARQNAVEEEQAETGPYAQVHLNDRVALWAIGGYGTGDMTIAANGDTPMKTDIDMTMAAAGLRGQVLDAGAGDALDMAVRTDALWLRTSTDATADMHGAEADVTPLRTAAGERITNEAQRGQVPPRGRNDELDDGIEVDIDHEINRVDEVEACLPVQLVGKRDESTIVTMMK